MSVSKRDFIKELVRQIPPGKEFTASMIVNLARNTKADNRFFIVGNTVSNVISGMEDVETVRTKTGTGKVYKRKEKVEA